MHRHYIHIGIAGLSIHDADELKKTLQHITPDHFILQWNTAVNGILKLTPFTLKMAK